MAPGQAEEAGDETFRIAGCSQPRVAKAWPMTRSMVAAFNSMQGSRNIADSVLVRWAGTGQGDGHNELLGDLGQ